MSRLVLALLALLLAGCGSGRDDTIEPLGKPDNASAARLMNEAERAAGNAQGRMRASAVDQGNNQQGETTK